jgi:sugar O-acyltransferase (sialic acid O-acetyltransferase NeuD family)
VTIVVLRLSLAMKIILTGAGGHGEVVADILLSSADAREAVEFVGYVDDDVATHGKKLIGGVVHGSIRDRGRVPHGAVIVSIGNNLVRRRVFLQLIDDGEQLAIARHPSAIVARDVTIGAGSVVAAGVIVNPGVRIGRNVILNTGSFVDHHCAIDDHVHIGPGARLGGGVSVGESTLIGIGAVVLPGLRIGQKVVVGGGAVVIRPVEDGLTVIGNPSMPLHALSESDADR